MNYPDRPHPSLGLLRYNHKENCYEGQITFQKHQISIYIETGDPHEIESILNRAERCVIRLAFYDENAKNFAAERLLEIKNRSWMDENEEPLTPEQFKACMLLESVAISPDGNLQFYYNDGDLFWGHCIAVTMDSSDRFIDADL
jgi:hypothetical protein